MNWIRFEYPLVLIGLFFVLIGLGVMMLRSVPSQAGRGGRKKITPRRIISLALRSLVVICLWFILAGAQLKGSSDYLGRIYLIDNSGSVFLNKIEVIDAIKNDIKKLKPQDRVAVVVFGEDVSIEVPPVSPSDFPEITYLSSRVNPEGTNIEKAVMLAKDLFPVDYRKELFLFSDGHETAGQTDRLIPLLRNEGITVYAIPTGPKELIDIKIDRWQMPESVAEHEPVQAQLIISSTIDILARAYVYQDNQLIRELNNITLFKDTQTALRLELPGLEKPVQAYEVQVVPIPQAGIKEYCRQNNSARALVRKSGQPSLLYLADATAPTPVETVLKNMVHFQVDAPGQDLTPAYFDRLALYQVLVLDNISVDFLKQTQCDVKLPMIKAFVENGGGLIILGGKSSFALGGYQHTLLNNLSPVWASSKDNLALAIVLDASGSMEEAINLPDQQATTTKFHMAHTALAETIPLLSKNDKLEVVTFNQDFEVVYSFALSEVDMMEDFSPVAELAKKLSSIKPSGSTIILHPLKERVLPALKNMTTARKHIILISDGESTGGETILDAQKFSESLIQAGVTISVLATGAKINEPFLKALNQHETNGRFYHISDISKLKDFLKEDLSYYKELYLEEKGLISRMAETDGVLKGIEGLPSLNGYNRTTLKENSRLLASLAKNNDPLVAQWQYGHGRVVSFSSSLNSSWAVDWLTWNKLGQFLTQLIRGVLPVGSVKGEVDQKFQISTQLVNHTDLKLTIIASQDDISLNYLNFKLKMYKSLINHQKSLEWDIPQVVPGRYEIIIPDLNEGSYLFTVFQGDKDEALASSPTRRSGKEIKTVSVIVPYSSEWTRFNPNLSYLKNMAEETGGKVLKNINTDYQDIILNDRDVRVYQKKDWLFIVLGLCFLLLDLLIYLPR